MTKFASILTAFALMLTMAPATFATHGHSSNDAPLVIKSAELKTKLNRVRGEVEVCNQGNENLRFKLNAKNVTINSLYQRNLYISGSTCRTYSLRFTKNFAEMSNAGDVVEIVAKKVGSFRSYTRYGFSNRYNLSDKLETVIEEGDKNVCDISGDDGIYSPCVGEFIDHEPSGLRIKVMTNDRDKVDLLLTHVEWGGVKKMRLYKGRNRTVRAGDNQKTRMKVTSIRGDSSYDLLIKLDSK